MMEGQERRTYVVVICGLTLYDGHSDVEFLGVVLGSWDPCLSSV